MGTVIFPSNVVVKREGNMNITFFEHTDVDICFTDL